MSFRAWFSILCLAFVFIAPTFAADAKTGYLVNVPVPLGANAANSLVQQLGKLADSAPQDGRLDVVLEYREETSGGEATSFEDALKVARAITGERLRSIRVVSLVGGKVSGHSLLPILASDAIFLTPSGELSDAMAGESEPDETIQLSYQSIAAKRGLFPKPLVIALTDAEVELAWVTKVGGGKVFAAGDELVKLRETGQVLGETVWSAPGAPASLTAEQLRSARISAGTVDSIQEVADTLDLAQIIPVESSSIDGEANGILLDIAGSISGNRVRRWTSNLTGTLDDQSINTWVITFDSIGGDMDQSAMLASLFASPEPPVRSVVGLITSEARSDSALLAVACKPLYMQPDATLGSTGADEITLQDLENHAELIDSIAAATKRPAGLIRGMLCNELEVFRYINKKTGKVRYTSPEELLRGVEDPGLERDRWEKGERIDLRDGLTAARAIELGLADGLAESLDEVSRRIGMEEVPSPVADRGIVRFVERLGRSQGLMVLLLMVGFIALSAEMNAPGMGVPGFMATVCFGMFFWMNYLAGTAEWLELVLLVLGLACIALEIFVIPGFGVFGIGGLVMTIASIVLMSQTFVLPQNSYQLTIITRGLWAALGSLLGLFGGFVLMRQLFPHVPLFRHLIMEAPDTAAIDVAERMSDYSGYLNQTGTTTTPLRPGGKARFGDEIIQVVSDGSMIDKGVEITVVEVQGSKVIVECQ